MKTRGTQRNRLCSVILVIAAALLCLALGSGMFVSRLMARYITQDSGSDSAKVAMWNARAAIETNNVNVDANEEYSNDGGYYSFTITPGASEVKSVYSVTVKLTDENGITAWPAGVVAKLTDGAGNELGEEGAELTTTTGVFEEIGTFDPGANSSVSFRLYLQAAYTTIGGAYSADITVTAEQVD